MPVKPTNIGFTQCSRLQGLHSASPRYTPAYTLLAPDGAFT